MNRSSRAWAIALVGLCFALVIQRFILIDHALGFFSDETVDILASANFFKTGIFGHGLGTLMGFERTPSSGLLTIWPAGLGWFLGGSVFWARFAFYLWGYVLALLLGALVFSELLPSGHPLLRARSVRVAVTTAVFLFFISFVPYLNSSAVYILGEWPSFLLLGIAFFLVRKRRHAGWFLFGLMLIHSKLVFYPIFAVVLLYSWIYQSETFKVFLTKAGRCMAILMGVFVLWHAYIYLRTGPLGFNHYVYHNDTYQFHHFVDYSKLDNTPVPTAKVAFHPIEKLKHRLADPVLDWHFYARVDKIRVAFLTVVPIVFLFLLSLRELIAVLRKKSHRIDRLILYGGLGACQSFYAVWFFYFHFAMWIRHYQPALLLGLSVLGAAFLVWFAQRNLVKRRFFGWSWTFILVALVFGRELFRSPTLLSHDFWNSERQAYSHVCRFEPASQVTNLKMLEICAPGYQGYVGHFYKYYYVLRYEK